MLTTGRRRAVVGVALLTTLLWAASSQASAQGTKSSATLRLPLTQAPCPHVRTSVNVFHAGLVPIQDWREALAFDGHGGMWVSPINANHLERYDPNGAVTETVQVDGPGGLDLGPDGLIYANTQGGSDGTGVVRFDPTQPHPTPTLVVNRPPGLNASTFDGDGFLYVSTEGTAPSVLRIRPDATRDTAWEQAASFYGANAVTGAGANLYAAISFDQRSPIELVPID